MTSFLQDPCSPSPRVQWNTFWESDFTLTDGLQTQGDWTIDGDSAFENNEIYSAVLMCIFTDRRAPQDLELPGDDDDRRGYHGDFYDVRTERGEAELGSLLWLYERAALTDDNIKGMEDAIRDCLLPLESQGLVADYDVTVEADKNTGKVCVGVTLYAQSRQKIFDARFTRLWAAIYPGLEVR